MENGVGRFGAVITVTWGCETLVSLGHRLRRGRYDWQTVEHAMALVNFEIKQAGRCLAGDTSGGTMPMSGSRHRLR